MFKIGLKAGALWTQNRTAPAGHYNCNLTKECTLRRVRAPNKIHLGTLSTVSTVPTDYCSLETSLKYFSADIKIQKCCIYSPASRIGDSPACRQGSGKYPSSTTPAKHKSTDLASIPRSIPCLTNCHPMIAEEW